MYLIWATMTYLDAAYVVLKAVKQPLHYSDITRRALAQGLIVPTGLTPEATMGSRLYTDTQEEGSRFVRAGRGVFEAAMPSPMHGCITRSGAGSVASPTNIAGTMVGDSAHAKPQMASSRNENETPIA